MKMKKQEKLYYGEEIIKMQKVLFEKGRLYRVPSIDEILKLNGNGIMLVYNNTYILYNNLLKNGEE